MTIQRLITAAARTAQVVDTISRRFARELATVLQDVERQLAPLLADAAVGSATAIVKAARANRTRKAIQQALVEAGYPDLVDTATQTPMDDVAAAVLAARKVAGLDAVISDSIRTRLEALQALYAQDLLEQGDVVSRALWQATVRGVFSARPTTRIVEDLQEVLDASAPAIRTLYDTSLSIYGRQVEALQAGNNPTATFAFMGPADQKNRPFCRDHVGKVYTRARIDEMDNGQTPGKPVFLLGGGWNCRHTWMEISKFSELQALVNTGERIPELQGAVAEAA